jgi:hypothetical protein
MSLPASTFHAWAARNVGFAPPEVDLVNGEVVGAGDSDAGRREHASVEHGITELKAMKKA